MKSGIHRAAIFYVLQCSGELQDTILVSRQISKIMPKLRKNKLLENKWGSKYFSAVKDAVFTMRPSPYMPSEPPPSLSKETTESQPLYVCKQCRDCFRFLSSLEDHTARRSWILGYWCQSCFYNCNHVLALDGSCNECRTRDREKRQHLRSRGLKRGRKPGSVKIFYNQCQFFVHVKSHQLQAVDMCDIMLMPIPLDVEKDQYTKLEKICEIMIEHMFITGVHILDWLRMKNMEQRWWELLRVVSDANLTSISDIVRNIRAMKLLPEVPPEIPTANRSSTQSLGSRMDVKSTMKSLRKSKSLKCSKSISPCKTTAINSISVSEVSESDDDPYTSTDIAFVDCGSPMKTFALDNTLLGITSKKNTESSSTSGNSTVAITVPMKIIASSTANAKHFRGSDGNPVYSISSNVTVSSSNSILAPKVSVKKFANESSGSNVVTNLWKDFSREYDLKKQMLKKLPEGRTSVSKTSLSLLASKSDKTPAASKTANSILSKQEVYAAATKPSTRILTVHNPKSTDLSSIINQLPKDVINGKKIIFIGQDAERGTNVSNQEMSINQGTIKLKSDAGQAKILKTVPLKMAPALVSVPNEQSAKLSAANAIHKILMDPAGSNVQQVTLDGKIIYKNGRKFIIRKPGTMSVSKVAMASNLLKTSDLSRSLIKKSIVGNLPKAATPGSPPGASSAPELPNSYSHGKLISASDREPEKSDLCSLGSDTFSEHMNHLYYSNMQNTNKTSEHLWIETDDSGQFYFRSASVVPEKQSGACHNLNALLPKYKEQMLDNLLHLSKAEIERRIEHLKSVNSMYSKLMKTDNDEIIQNNLKALKHLEDALKEPVQWNSEEGNSEKQLQEEIESMEKEWEVDLQNEDFPKCGICKKAIKPKSYIIGISRMKCEESNFCNCYNSVCYICKTFQINSTKLRAHINYHEKCEPFECPECLKRYASFKKLESHVWTSCFHPLLRRWFSCIICEVDGFLDLETVTRHFAICHSERKVACSECHLVLSSHASLKKHQDEAHPDTVVKPVRLMVCNLGQCVVKPVNFRCHVDNHVGVARMYYYKCLFCSFLTKDIDHGKEEIKNHLSHHHADQLCELYNNTACDLENEISTEITSKENQDTETNLLVPKIVSTTSITPEVFEQNSQNVDDNVMDSGNVDSDSQYWIVNGLPKIIDVRTEAKSSKSFSKTSTIPKTLDVRSMAVNGVAEDSEFNEKPMHNNIKSNKELLKIITKDSHKITKQRLQARAIIKSSKRVTSTTSDSMEKTKMKSKEEIRPIPPLEPISRMSSLSKKIVLLSESEGNSSKVSRDTEDKSQRSILRVVEILPGKGKVNKIQDARNPLCISRNLLNESQAIQFQSMETKDGNLAARVSSILQPPPLARIPEHLLSSIKKVEVGKARRIWQDRNLRLGATSKQKRRRKRPWRIAVNGPDSESLDYRCHLCRELINTSPSTIRNHFNTRHSRDYKLVIVAPRLLRMSKEFIEGGYRELYGSRKRKSDTVTSTAKRRRRWTPKKYIERTNSPGTGLFVQQEPVQDGEGNFKCKKCNSKCGNMTELREHIASYHRIKGRYLICLECGENFVVAPSLQMHLKAFHGIDDPITYMTQNTGYAPETTDEAENESKATVSNQCYVCMAVFEDKAAVDKHLRVHGMAFLNRKRIEAQNALKSPPKNNKLDNSSEKSVNDDDSATNTTGSASTTPEKDNEEKTTSQ
ncbi:uncharacterized protein LOC107274222 isoform X2 [Cephus cinctus]|uniref:Uncharacterized protein LOC107274222 isoform X2 n=1 Tax=Cephus cinctus TaxID=211228 RepID=A0AAJ7W7I6_CEPCN|nr:uncharacterized protein LOC107274222 isoform X2 [Cephus cinctus]XP_024947296.1 uncharacterized protein LOC107274222 isoform X2 [Cephus cinctus]